MPPAPPLILTAEMDALASERFGALRRRHFPPERNHIPAHLTLFHHLPGESEEEVLADLAAALAGRAPPLMEVTGLRFLGRGVAYALASPSLSALRADLARTWSPWLGPQDRQAFRPHVTVQNKVGGAEARALLRTLEAEFQPFAVQADALLLWRYLGGPWAAAGRVAFGASGDGRRGASE